MQDGLILAIDQGTTNTKGLLVDRAGEIVFRASAAVPLIHTLQEFVEQDPQALWDSVVNAVGRCMARARQTGTTIEAIAITNQRETTVAWDGETGEPAANAVSWQCGRAAEICNRLVQHGDEIRRKTGLPLAPLISAGKWAWLLENDQHVQTLLKAGRLRLGTVDSWLLHKFTRSAVHVTDLSNASRTGLLSLNRLDWDEELLRLFGIPAQSMASPRDSSGDFGHCTVFPELDGVPILAMIGDSHGAMFGHGSYSSGTVKATYGTGSSLMGLTATLAADTQKLARTIAWSIGGDAQFALEGNIAMTGAAVQWVGEFLGLREPAQDAAALAGTVADSLGVYFVPAMVGLGAPYWNAKARGTITGLGRSHSAAHLARAAVESIAFQVTDVLLAMEDAGGVPIPELLVDGGATRNSTLMQFQADILGRPVLRSATEELSALGAAMLAGLALGWWKSPNELEHCAHRTERFEPQMKAEERKRIYDDWKCAVRRAQMETGADA